MSIEQSRKNRLIISVVILVAVVVCVGGFKMFTDARAQSNEIAPSQEPSDASGDVWSLRAKEIDLTVLKNEGVPIIIDFGSDDCVPCKEMAPALKKVNTDMQGKAIVKFVDVWENPNASSGFPVQIIPTQIIIGADGSPYTPSDEVASELGLELLGYQDDSGAHVFTAHQGALTEAQMNGILSDMGVS